VHSGPFAHKMDRTESENLPILEQPALKRTIKVNFVLLFFFLRG